MVPTSILVLTISVSNLSYLTTENTGVSQFPLELLPVAEGTELNASFTQAKPTEKTYYLNGGVSDRYLTTTEILSEAVAVYAEKVEGGYKFYILVDGVKNYITIYSNSDNKDSVKYDPNGNTVFTYKADVNAWATTFNGVDKYLGTYYYEKNNSTYSTVSVSNLSYITSENTGVTQYPLTYSIPAHVCDFAAATCTKPATCSCGAVQEGSTALGHNKVDGECANCHAKYVTLTEAAALADNTLVFVEVTVSKITFAWSDSSKNMSVDVTDGTTTLNAYKLGSKVGAGDVIVIYGKVSSYNNVKQIAEGATAEIKTAHVCSTNTDGKCPVCGAKEPVANLAKATSVAVGDTVYIVCETAKAEMNAFSTTSTIYGTHVEYTGAVTGAYAWTLVAGATDGTFAFKNADGKYMTWKSGNSLVLSDTVDANSSWTITFEDGNAIITNSADTTRNLRWNASAPRFATYTSAQTMIQLYK